MYVLASPEDRDMYDFKRFFINTFYNTKQDTRREFVIKEDDEEVIDRNIVVFIRDRLLSQRG